MDTDKRSQKRGLCIQCGADGEERTFYAITLTLCESCWRRFLDDFRQSKLKKSG